MQYTIRGISEDIDRIAREQAERENVSLNQVLVRALRSGFGIEESPTQKRDFQAVFKGEPLEPEVLAALEDQRTIDWEMWDTPPDEPRGSEGPG